MPKMKTKRNAKKRFKKSGSGKLKRFKAGARHLLTRKGPKRKPRSFLPTRATRDVRW